MVKTARVVAIVYQTVSKASHRPGHTLRRVYFSGYGTVHAVNSPSSKAEDGLWHLVDAKSTISFLISKAIGVKLQRVWISAFIMQDRPGTTKSSESREETSETRKELTKR